MTNSKIVSDTAPEPVGLYPHARKVGNLLFMSGVGPRQKGTKDIPGVELDADGKIVWQLTNVEKTYSAERLSNGNTLIAHRTDVREVDRDGRIVWVRQMTDARHATRY